MGNETLFSRSSGNDQKLLRLVAHGETIFGAATAIGPMLVRGSRATTASSTVTRSLA